jgi:hypothetical protein
MFFLLLRYIVVCHTVKYVHSCLQCCTGTQLFSMLLRYTAVCHIAQVHSCLPLCSGTQLFAMLLRYAAVCHAAQVRSCLPGCSGPCTQLFVSLKIFKFALNFAQNRLRSNTILELFIKAKFGQVLATINNFLLNMTNC